MFVPEGVLRRGNGVAIRRSDRAFELASPKEILHSIDRLEAAFGESMREWP